MGKVRIGVRRWPAVTLSCSAVMPFHHDHPTPEQYVDREYSQYAVDRRPLRRGEA